MILREERELIIEYGKKLIEENLTVGTFGNISMYNKNENLMAITPSGMDYFSLKPEDIVILTPDGEKVDGDRKPSSEYDMHRIFYQKRDGINAVVHTHSTYATTLACLNWSIPPLHYLTAYSGKEVPCSRYVKFGTYDLAESALETMADNYACILGNHGLLTAGETLAYAFDVAQQVEFLSQLYYQSKVVGEPVLLSDNQIQDVLEAFITYRTK